MLCVYCGTDVGGIISESNGRPYPVIVASHYCPEFNKPVAAFREDELVESPEAIVLFHLSGKSSNDI